MAVGDRPAPAEVGLMRAEHDPAGRAPRPEVDGIGQARAHAVPASGLKSHSWPGRAPTACPADPAAEGVVGPGPGQAPPPAASAAAPWP